MTKANRRSGARKAARNENILGTLMASGPFIGYLLFGLLPMAASLVLSFTEMHGFDLTMAHWVGFSNYINVVQTPYFWRAVGNTVYYCLSVPINLGVALFLANLLTKHLKFTEFTRVILFIPSVCSGVGITLMWLWILDADHGAINTLLALLGMPKIGFITTPQWFMPSVLLISLWMKGTNIVLTQSALANVNEELKEAAKIDGASEMRIFWSIVVPSITPTLFYLFVTNLIAALQEMQVMQIISGNGLGPDFRAVTLSYYMYRMTYVNYATEGMGMAASLSWIVTVAIMILTFFNFKFSKKWVNYD